VQEERKLPEVGSSLEGILLEMSGNFQGVEPLEKPLEGQMEKETGKIRDVLRSYMNLQ
jgi:hypothetical protein